MAKTPEQKGRWAEKEWLKYGMPADKAARHGREVTETERQRDQNNSSSNE
ncbi:hypothetical protein [Micromonospora sediminicola]